MHSFSPIPEGLNCLGSVPDRTSFMDVAFMHLETTTIVWHLDSLYLCLMGSRYKRNAKITFNAFLKAPLMTKFILHFVHLISWEI